jgi:hypothetical protein
MQKGLANFQSISSRKSELKNNRLHIMDIAEKLAALFKKYRSHPDKGKDLDPAMYEQVRGNGTSIAIPPAANDNTRLWIGYDVEWWRVMVSCRDKRFVTAEIRKQYTSAMPDGDFIVYEVEDKKWNLAEPIKAGKIIEVIKRSIDTSYEQFSQQ